MRHDFTPTSKRTLAQRAGYICSFPNCENLTIGPSEEHSDKTNSVGMACHIFSAADGKGAKRINFVLTPQQLMSLENGIWMCYTHGKLIDTDEKRFTPDILKNWKLISENIAKIRIEQNVDYSEAKRMFKNKLLVSNAIEENQPSNLNKSVGNIYLDSCLSILWGKEKMETIRDFTIEHFRNAFEHGSASNVRIIIEENKIQLIDNGTQFNPRILSEKSENTGGVLSAKFLINDLSNSLLFSTVREDDKNRVMISKPVSRKQVKELTPCSVEINRLQLENEHAISYTVDESCKEIYFFLPTFFSFSDIGLLYNRFIDLEKESRQIIFVVDEVSTNVQRILTEQFPDSKILLIEEKSS